MTTLRLEDFPLPAAELGVENPLPAIAKAADIHSHIKTDATFPPEDLENYGWGMPPYILPYRYQDGFDRTRKERVFKAAVLENAHLRAVFIPELGGHLWSLFSKDSNRELLASNPVFQPCNLAIRKAWISGGVEWNFGWTGHWPLTCSPLFSAFRKLDDGTPELRMWEYERVRRMPLQIDAWLPDDSKALFVRISIHNPSDHTTPVYWWTNIAAPQAAGTRVLVSADETLLHNYATHSAGSSSLPVFEDDEITYPGRMAGARDYFFRVPSEERHPWEIALQPDCHGLFQTSTSRLRGRKLFRWGTQSGGETWQRFLGSPDYIEIQAGLARTQMHHLPMPAGETWTWIEAFGEALTGPSAFSEDWDAARSEGEKAVRKAVPGELLDRLLDESSVWANVTPTMDEIVTCGSGWGALELARRRKANEHGFTGLPGTFFPHSSIGPAQTPWLSLLEGGVYAATDNSEAPGEFCTTEYLGLLGSSFGLPGGENWISLFHYGVALWQDGKCDEAIAAWRASMGKTKNAWSLRCIGVAKRVLGDRTGSADVVEASRILPKEKHLAREAISVMNEDCAYAKALDFEAGLCDEPKSDSRIRIGKVRALSALGRIDEAEALLLATPVPADIKEGETTLSSLWLELQARRAGLLRPLEIPTKEQVIEYGKSFKPPVEIDFRM